MGQGSSSEQVEGVVSLEQAKAHSGSRLRTISRYHVGVAASRDYDCEDQAKVLGNGMGGNVVLGTCRLDGKDCAIKVFNLQSLGEIEQELIRTEAEIYLTLDHPNIARLYDVYDDSGVVTLVMEYCSGGELFHRLMRQKTYSEAQAAEATRQILHAVSYLHHHNVVHRDLKLENFLYQDESDTAELKLIDFGFAKYWDSSTLMLDKCGSLQYVSPDVLSNKGYTSQVDMWSLGVTVFMMLAGYAPFGRPGKAETLRQILYGKTTWFQARWDKVSSTAQDFVFKLLEKNPEIRMSAQQALQHPWLSTEGGDEHKIQLDLTLIKSLHRFARTTRLRRAALQLIAQELSNEEIRSKREMWLQLDKENKGAVKLNDLKQAIQEPRKRPPPIMSSPTKREVAPKGFEISPDRGSYASNGSNASPLSTSTSVTSALRADSPHINEMLATLDENGDGEVDFTDFVAATMATPQACNCEKAMLAAFQRFDKDRSGRVDVEDVSKLLGDENAMFPLWEAKSILVEARIEGDMDFNQFTMIVENGSHASKNGTKSGTLQTLQWDDRDIDLLNSL